MKTCKKCKETKPLSEYYVCKRDGIVARCKACMKRHSKKHYVENPEKFRERLLVRKYGLTIEDYDAMLENQGGSCAICNTTDPRGHGRFHVDHNHKTGVVRGLLCTDCNTGIGSLKDSPEHLRAAAIYLETQGYYG